jgi:putative SOS response-associated peptidase YedK
VDKRSEAEEIPPRRWHEARMCNLYSIKTRRADLARRFRLSDNRMAVFGTLPAIFPGGMAPIIKQSADGRARVGHAQLGVHSLARWLCAQARDQHTRRQGANQILEEQLR